MRFCDKCGLILNDEISECSSCKHINLIETDKEKAGFASIKNEMNKSANIPDSLPFNSKNETFSEMSQFDKVPNFARLVVTKGGTQGREFPVNKDICNIGRWDPSLKSHPEIDLSDEDIDAKVSRLHARIVKKPEGYYIEDVGSRNGTFLNREFRLVQGIEYSLKNNDEVIIGHVFFRFEEGQ
jgi:pSer/pThr/pTyr-binding forkhead associated (FHA) protein